MERDPFRPMTVHIGLTAPGSLDTSTSSLSSVATQKFLEGHAILVSVLFVMWVVVQVGLVLIGDVDTTTSPPFNQTQNDVEGHEKNVGALANFAPVSAQ